MEVAGRRNNEQKEVLDESDGNLCHPCKEDGSIQQAYGYCLNCKEHLCETCYKYHRRPKPFKDHELVQNGSEEYESKKETGDEPPPVPERRKKLNTKCHIHTNEDLKYHCGSHRVIICSVCALKKHKECDNVDYIPDIYETENKRVVEIVEYVEGKIEYKLKQEMDAVQLAEKSCESALSEIKTQKGQVSRYFEEKEKYFIDRLSTFREESKKRERELFVLAQKLKTDKVHVTPTNPDPEVNKFIAMQETETAVNNINKELLGVFAHPTFTVSYKNQQPLASLGEATVVEQQGNVSKRKMKLLGKVDIAGGKPLCSLTDAALLSEDRIVFTDYRNERLILIIDESEPVFHTCPSAPWGVSCISETEIAVTFPSEHEVRFLEITRTISSSNRKSIEISGGPYGIRYLKSGSTLIIAVVKAGGMAFKSWSLKGQLLSTVASFSYVFDYLALTVDQKILCSSDSKHIVHLLEIDGTVLKTFKYVDDNMSGPYGIASDDNGNIYVCGVKCLRVVSKQGIWEEIISPEDGFAPQSLQICHSTSKLYVGQAQYGLCKEVLIYQL